jgi:hypothetical protein
MQIIEVTDLGVRAAVIRLRRRESPLQFVIYPMIHMAKASFYTDVAVRLRRADVVVVEGVGAGDRRGSVLVSALTLSYRVLKFNRRVGLVQQNIDYAALGKQLIHPDVSGGEFREGWRRVPLKDRLMLWLVLPVVVIGRLFGGTAAIWSKAMEVEDLPSTFDEEMADRTPELSEAFAGERDVRLLDALSRLHRERSHEAVEVAVVYGAGHVAKIVHELNRQHGYRPRSADWLTVTDL